MSKIINAAVAQKQKKTKLNAVGHEHDLEAVSVSRIVVSFEIFCFIFGKFCLGSFGIGFISKKKLQYQW